MLNMTDKYYNRLKQIQQDNPQLTFQNEGYQYLNREIVENHKSQIAEITEILKTTVEDFVRFDNFKISKIDEGAIKIRCQCYYDRKNTGFVGVRYYELEDFKNFEEDEN